MSYKISMWLTREGLLTWLFILRRRPKIPWKTMLPWSVSRWSPRGIRDFLGTDKRVASASDNRLFIVFTIFRSRLGNWLSRGVKQLILCNNRFTYCVSSQNLHSKAILNKCNLWRYSCQIKLKIPSEVPVRSCQLLMKQIQRQKGNKDCTKES